MYSFCRYRGIRTQLLSCLVRSLHRTTSSPTSILLCESYPKLVELLHPVDQYAIGYNLSPMTTVCSWKCPNQEDHEWKMSIQKAIKLFTSNVHQNICPFCNGSAVCKSNSLAFHNPDIARELSKSETLDASKISSRSHQKVRWSCPHGDDHDYSQLISRRTDSHASCPYCSSALVCKSNSLSSRYPELALEFDEERNDPLTASALLPTSTLRVWWKCSQGHQWQSSVNNRAKGMSYCKVCGSNKMTSLETVCPGLASCWSYDHNLNSSPRSISIGSQHRAFWSCSQCQTVFCRNVADAYKQYIRQGNCWCEKCSSSSSF